MRPTIVTAALLLLAGNAWAAEPFVVHPADIADQKAVIGAVEPVHELAARARIGGTIASLTVKEGQEVAAGAEIAVVADPKLVLQKQALDSRIEFAAVAARPGEGGLRAGG